MAQWFDNRLLELKVIYRGSSHQFTRASFDAHCLYKGPTLSLINSENGRLFGGYTSQPWRSGHANFNFYSEDDQAFLFSFDKKEKLKIRPDKKYYAIRHHHHCLSYFGYSGDIGPHDAK